MPQAIPGAKTAQKNTFGGFNSASLYSGAVAPSLAAAPGAVAVGSDVLFVSGAGRLDGVTLFTNPVAVGRSGIQIGFTFYDAHAPVSGGPIAASGHKPIAQLPEFLPAVVSGGLAIVSGVAAFNPPYGNYIPIGAPFQSGLVLNSRSGQPGITVFWTPETANQ